MKDSPYVKTSSAGSLPFKNVSAALLGRLDIELTERCNNECIHCCINRPPHDDLARDRELPTREIERLLNEAASLGCMTIRFTGGEPLLREDFRDLYVTTRKLGMRVMLSTNATLLTPELVGLLSKIPPLEKVEITVYGMKESSYEGVTGNPGSYAAARRGMELLLENRIPFIVKSVILPPNKGDIEEFEEWAGRIPWMEGPPRYAMLLDLRSRRDSLAKNRRIREMRAQPKEALRVLMRSPQEFEKDVLSLASSLLQEPNDLLFTCGAGLGGGCVDAYGFYQPCIKMRHPDTVFDLKSGRLRDALEQFVPKIRMKRAQNPEYRKRCARCFLKGLCEQCPAKSWSEHGTLDSPVEHLCEMAHLLACSLDILAPGEKAWEIEDAKGRIHNWISTKQPLQQTSPGTQTKGGERNAV